jgi:hypothetical protein
MNPERREIEHNPLPAGGGEHTLCREVMPARRLLHVLILGMVMACGWPARATAAVTLALQFAPGGITTTSFGNVNGLGVGVPTAGLTLITTGVSGGVVYSTPYELVISGLPGADKATVSIYVSSNFTRPALLVLQSCYPSAGCTAGGAFTTISLSAATPTGIITTAVGNGTYIANFGLFVSNADGAGVSAGADSVSLTWKATDTTTLQTSTPAAIANSVTLQTAVQLLLATAPGGITVSPAADYSMNYGNVNGLGIAPGAGLTVSAAAGGVIYGTPYLIQPSFSTFSSTTSTVKVYVSMDFAHPAILQLEDAAVLAGPYTAISKNAGAQTTVTTTAGTGTSVTRYLGLFVSNANGAGTFTGADSATLTYTLTVP